MTEVSCTSPQNIGAPQNPLAAHLIRTWKRKIEVAQDDVRLALGSDQFLLLPAGAASGRGDTSDVFPALLVCYASWGS